MSEPDEKKPRDIEELPGFSPELLAGLPPAIRAQMEKIRFDIRFDLKSILAEPCRASLLEQIAVAACDPAEAAFAIVQIAAAAHDGIFHSVERKGQIDILKWVLAAYVPTKPRPPELLEHLALYLRPAEKKPPSAPVESAPPAPAT